MVGGSEISCGLGLQAWGRAPYGSFLALCLGRTQLPASVLFSGKQLYLEASFLLPQNRLEDL